MLGEGEGEGKGTGGVQGIEGNIGSNIICCTYNKLHSLTIHIQKYF